MKEGMESLGRIRFQGLALLALAFVTGLLGGTAGERLMNSRPRIEAFPPPGGRGVFWPGLQEQLQLTPAQDSAIALILERRRRLTDSLFTAMRATADSLRGEIREVLTPDQQAEFDRWAPPAGPRPAVVAPFMGPGPGRMRDGPPPAKREPSDGRGRTPGY